MQLTSQREGRAAAEAPVHGLARSDDVHSFMAGWDRRGCVAQCDDRSFIQSRHL
jgi:hypothetical protein